MPKKLSSEEVRLQELYLQQVNEDLIAKATGDGIRHPERIRAAGSVTCRGKKKRIYLICSPRKKKKRGEPVEKKALVISPDHNISRENALIELGGKACRCVRVRREFAEHRSGKIPATFAKIVNENRRLREDRILKPSGMSFTRLVKRYNERGFKNQWLRELHRRLRLTFCYKTTRYKIVKDPQFQIGFTISSRKRVAIHGGIHYFRRFSRVTQKWTKEVWRESYVKINLDSYQWRDVLCKERLEVIEGYFVAGIMEPTDKDRWQTAESETARCMIRKARKDCRYVVPVVIAYEERHKNGPDDTNPGDRQSIIIVPALVRFAHNRPKLEELGIQPHVYCAKYPHP